MTDKPWMRPVLYNDAQPVDSSRDSVSLESDIEPMEQVRRSVGDREASKPQFGSKDTEPMKYVPWHRRLTEVLDVDDGDEAEENSSG
jgi:hypothetical protein